MMTLPLKIRSLHQEHRSDMKKKVTKQRSLGVMIAVGCMLVAWTLIGQNDGLKPLPTIRLKAIILPTGNRAESQLMVKTECLTVSEVERCALLRKLGRDRLSLKPGLVCSQQYGRAAVVHLTGWWGDEKINETLKLHNGCEISRWRSLQYALALPRI